MILVYNVSGPSILTDWLAYHIRSRTSRWAAINQVTLQKNTLSFVSNQSLWLACGMYCRPLTVVSWVHCLLSPYYAFFNVCTKSKTLGYICLIVFVIFMQDCLIFIYFISYFGKLAVVITDSQSFAINTALITIH